MRRPCLSMVGPDGRDSDNAENELLYGYDNTTYGLTRHLYLSQQQRAQTMGASGRSGVAGKS